MITRQPCLSVHNYAIMKKNKKKLVRNCSLVSSSFRESSIELNYAAPKEYRNRITLSARKSLNKVGETKTKARRDRAFRETVLVAYGYVRILIYIRVCSRAALKKNIGRACSHDDHQTITTDGKKERKKTNSKRNERKISEIVGSPKSNGYNPF